MSDAVAHYRSITADLAVGSVLKSDDAAWLCAAMGIAVQTDVSIERAMNLPRKWREQIRITDAFSCLLNDGDAKTLLARISKYRGGEFKSFRAKGIVPPDNRASIHRFLIAYQGKIPSLRTVQRHRPAPRLASLSGAGAALTSEYGKTNIHTDTRARSLPKYRG
jgi:hypothetical protein